MTIKEINSEEFNDIIKENGQIVIDCYAPWCGPCKMLAPILEDLALNYPHIEFYKLNVDNNPLIANNYDIMSIPTILFFENGTLKHTSIGLKSQEELVSILNS